MNPEVKRISSTEAQASFGRIVDEVITTDMPVIIQTQSEDEVVLISLRDFQRFQTLSSNRPAPERERVHVALQAVGMLSEPTPEMRRRAAEYDVQHSDKEQKQVLTDLRDLHLDPPLSQILLESRDWRISPATTDES